jgi:hypothetical protein
MDGSPLADWFRLHRPLMADVSLAEVVPQGWESVPPQSVAEFMLPVGAFKNAEEVFNDLCVLLPRTFPLFQVSPGRGSLEILVARPLTQPEVQALHGAMCGIQLELAFTVRVATIVPPGEDPQPKRGIALVASRRLPLAAAKGLRDLAESDEDFWIDTRAALFGGDTLSLANVLPPQWRPSPSRCVVPAAVFPACNIRNYLSIYREVVLVAPLAEKSAEILHSLRCEEADIVQLAESGRLRILLPQSIGRYDLKFLSSVTEVAPDAVLFSRRLAAATVVDSRRRIPLLYPTLGPQDRTVVLRALHAMAAAQPDSSLRWDLVLQEIARIYSMAEVFLHSQGAMATASLGVGALVSRLYEAVSGRDLFIEFAAAASLVEWSALLGATAFPVASKGYSEAAACEMLASAYSGVQQGSVQPIANGLMELLPQILTVDNNAPLVEFTDVLAGGDIDRLRQLLISLAAVSDFEARAEAVRNFNSHVRNFEKDAEKRKSWDIVSLMGAVGPLLLPGPGKYVGLAMWMLRRLLASNELTRFDSTAVGRFVDALNGPLSSDGSDVVLVSRVRSGLKR